MIFPFGLANQIDLSSAGDMLFDGFNLAVLYIPVTEGDKTRICIVAIKGEMTGFIHIGWIYFATSCHLA